MTCSLGVSAAVERHHDHDTLMKEKHLIGVTHILRGLGRHDVGEAKSPVTWLAGKRKWPETLGMV